jgi:alkyldihydroxyacetonephosphate synthase
MTERIASHWGWGWEDRFPDAAALRSLSERVSAALGVSAAEPRGPRPLADVTLPPARGEVPPELAAFCVADREARIRHAYGKSYRDQVRAFAGDFRSAPDLVAIPRSEDDVARVLEWASRENVAVVPFGGGTSVTGGVEPDVGGAYRATLSLDVRRLSRVREVDPLSRAARIEAGATGPAIEAALASHGLTLRHFPQSFEFSTLGGWIATRAGGHFATVYTHIDDLVESVRLLTPGGIWQTGRFPASGAGPDPVRLALGSEGALGVVTEAWVRVQPRPRFLASATVHFEDFAHGAEAVRAIAQSGLHPANCRLLDPGEAMLNSVATDGHAVLVLAFESADHALGPWIDRALAISAEHGATCREGPHLREHRAGAGERDRAAEAASWRSAFLAGPYLQSALVSLGLVADTFETACTWDRFPALHEGVCAVVLEAMQRACGSGVLTCRFTHVYPDGPAPYYTFVAPARSGGELEAWAAVKRAASDAIQAQGGTITHHHAVGRLHAPWYERERPEPFARALAAAKAAVDPAWILNPGVLVRREGSPSGAAAFTAR